MPIYTLHFPKNAFKLKWLVHVPVNRAKDAHIIDFRVAILFSLSSLSLSLSPLSSLSPLLSSLLSLSFPQHTVLYQLN